MKPEDYLRAAAEVIEQRGQLRDKPDGERSMERAVDAYITLNGPQMQTELDGWIFMSILKLARATAGKPHIYDWTDLAGYAALAAECVEKDCKITPSSGDVFEDLEVEERPWIPWQGGKMPIPGNTLVEVHFRDGVTVCNNRAGNYSWKHGPEEHEYDIVAYRVND